MTKAQLSYTLRKSLPGNTGPSIALPSRFERLLPGWLRSLVAMVDYYLHFAYDVVLTARHEGLAD